MAISNITNKGTIANPIISADIDGIQFTNIPSGEKGTKGSAFWNHSANTNVWKAGGDGTQWKPSVNAVDIDWNGAKPNIPNIPENGITTTGDLVEEVYSPMFAKAA